MYEIRLALEADEQLIVQFIDQHWKKNHVVASCKELRDWQHLDRATEKYNFILGIEQKSGDLHGMLGFIPLSQFDREIERSRLCWTAIWKIQDAARGHKLGRRLLSYLEDTVKPEILAGIATSAMSVPLYQARGDLVGRLSHHFILHPAKTAFHLVTCPDGFQRVINVHDGVPTKTLQVAAEGNIASDAGACFLAQEDLPHKTPEYLVNRYFRHPFYRYQAYLIREEEVVLGIVVTRVCCHEQARAIRVVDFIGPSRALRGLEGEWARLLNEHDAEYLDFYNAGINAEDLLDSGFLRRQEGDGFVIPNHFEPFLKKNVEIEYMIKLPQGKSYRIVKGDSDQDRPNLIKGV